MGGAVGWQRCAFLPVFLRNGFYSKQTKAARRLKKCSGGFFNKTKEEWVWSVN